jgi:hypothetical protein
MYRAYVTGRPFVVDAQSSPKLPSPIRNFSPVKIAVTDIVVHVAKTPGDHLCTTVDRKFIFVNHRWHDHTYVGPREVTLRKQLRTPAL